MRPGYVDVGPSAARSSNDRAGLTGSEYEDPQVGRSVARAGDEKNLIGPVLVVFRTGSCRAYYADCADGNMPSETRVVRELVPWNRRQIPHGRAPPAPAVTASRWAATAPWIRDEFPDLRVGVAYDAALDTWARRWSCARAAIAQAIRGNMEAYFDKYRPGHSRRERGRPARRPSGCASCPARPIRVSTPRSDHLQGPPIPLDYVETTAARLGCALGCAGCAELDVIQAAFTR